MMIRVEPLTRIRRALRRSRVIDEIQQHPELFPILRVLADRKPLRAWYFTRDFFASFRKFPPSPRISSKSGLITLLYIVYT